MGAANRRLRATGRAYVRFALDELMDAGGLPPERRPNADVTAWSAVHGISMLMLEGPLRDLSEGEREAALDSLLATVERGLTGQDADDR